jgi:putative spermidine/putrescine transport system ATP-binding protein
MVTGGIEKLELRGLSRRFGAATALHNFSLEIKGGSFVTLLGPSGCGKSTALNCLAGLLELSEGEILLNNKPIQQLPAEKRGFGMVFQNYALFPHLNVMRNVGYGLEIRGVPKAERERRVLAALKLVQLGEFGKRFPAQLSGGQQQRLAIARTIVLEPHLLLLDEPLSNLDTKLRIEMRIEIKRLHDQLGLTTLYVTHDQSEAMSMSDTVVVMQRGNIEQIGPPSQIYNYPKSLYVATFMGYSNQIRVELVRREQGKWLVATSNGEELLATSTLEDNASWHPGQPVLACFRPDDALAEVEPATSAINNRLEGQVQLVEYMGKTFETLVRLKGTAGAQLLVHSYHQPVVNEALVFGIAPERLLLFPLATESNGNTSASSAVLTEELAPAMAGSSSTTRGS